MEVRGAEAYLALALVKGKLRDPPPPPTKLLGPAHGVPDGKQDMERTVDAESPGNTFFFFLPRWRPVFTVVLLR